eukprot:6695750-Pyramimonas_sp.AAC.3
MQSERSYDELISTAIQYLQAATVHGDGHQQKWPSPPGPGAEGGKGSRTSGAREVGALTRQYPKGKGKDDRGTSKNDEGKNRSKDQKGKGSDPMARTAATRQPAWSMIGVPGARLCYTCGQRGHYAMGPLASTG